MTWPPDQGPPSAAGYASASYATAFGHEPHRLAACGGHLLLRPIADTGLRDASGCYPVFSCRDPRGLADDLAALPPDLVALTLVPDPLQDFELPSLQRSFPIVRPLGEHYVVELEVPRRPPNSHHRRMLRRAAAHPIECRREPAPAQFLGRWVGLYDILVAQVGIRGLRRFSAPIFQAMLAAPGTVLFTAWEGELLLGADWYYQDQDRVYAHLSAYTQQGYERSVSYPMLDTAIAHFADRARILDLGGIPTLAASSDGLRYFKAGWATGVLPAYFCGKAMDLGAYLRLSGDQPPSAQAFFPRYRSDDYA